MNLPTLPTAAAQLERPSVGERRPLLTELPENDYLLVLDNSAFEKFVTCPRSAEFYLVYEREAYARNAALVFGGALHAGLELYHLGEAEEKQNTAVKDFFRLNPAPPDEYRTEVNALEVLRLYRQEAAIREDYKWEILRNQQGELIVERAFELPLGIVPVDAVIQLPSWPQPKTVRDIHVAWSGRIDVLTSVMGHSYITDNKTTKIGDDKFIQDFQLSNQTQGYVWAAQKLWPEHEVNGFCLNAIWFRKPTSAGPLNEKGPRGGEPALRFFRSYFQYQPETIKRWEFNALTIVGDFIHNLVRRYHPMHTKWCFGKYGRCQYHDVCCIQDPQTALRYLQSEVFKPVTWDPVAGK